MGWVLIALICLMSGCTSMGQLGKDQEFNRNSSNGLVVLGVNVQGDFKSPRLTFIQYDPVSGMVNSKTKFEIEPRMDALTDSEKFSAFMSGQSSRPGGHDYFIFEVPPGEWILVSINGTYIGGGVQNYISNTFFNKGTFTFSVRQGVALYGGEFDVRGRFGYPFMIVSQKPDIASASEKLKSFNNIHEALSESLAKSATFSCKSQLISDKCDLETIVVKKQ